nr:FtsQ-type POTRA domain-containing protein [uncultured Merdimonas sp.]
MGKRKTRRKSHRLYAFVVLLLAAAILVLGILILFYVQEIEVDGNEYCTDQQIIDTVKNDKYSVNTLYILGKYALGKGETLPCLDSMKVTMSAPWALKVKVKEKPIVGYVQSEDSYVYFDKEGMVVSKSTALIEGLPCIEGINVKGIKLYSQLESEDSKIFEEILEASQEVAKYELSVDRIVCREDQIYLYIGKVYVNLGNKVSSDQVAQISPILEKLGDQEGTLHLENYSEMSGTITFDIGEIPQ